MAAVTRPNAALAPSSRAAAPASFGAEERAVRACALELERRVMGIRGQG
jgi:hypothetical protein